MVLSHCGHGFSGRIRFVRTVPVTILVDYGERRSRLPTHLVELGLGLDVTLCSLDVGDVSVSDRAVVERKTVPDLHRSIATGRLWRQVGSMRSVLSVPYLVVEGVDLSAGPVVPEGVRGALLAVAESGVTVIRSADVEDSAAWIRSIAIRVTRSASRPTRRRSRARSGSAYDLLRAVPGVTPRAARGLLERFGSVAGVAAATEAELGSVQGVGRATVASLVEVFH
jgi:DNA excision repair protein ERCC-4